MEARNPVPESSSIFLTESRLPTGNCTHRKPAAIIVLRIRAESVGAATAFAVSPVAFYFAAQKNPHSLGGLFRREAVKLRRFREVEQSRNMMFLIAGFPRS